MKHNKILRISLIAVSLLFFILGDYAAPMAKTASLQPAGLGPFIEIWNDALKNMTPVVAYNPQSSEYMVVWSTQQDSFSTDIWARRVHINGSLDSWFNVYHYPGKRYENPAIAYSPESQEYLVVYTDITDSANMNLYANSFRWDGSVITSQFEIDASVNNQDKASIAYNSQANEFLIVYESAYTGGSDIYGRRYRLSDHTLLPPVPIAPSSNTKYRNFPDVAYNAVRNSYFITYEYYDATITKLILMGRRVSSDLGILVPEVDLVTRLPPCSFPAIAAGYDGYLVTCTTQNYIYARLLDGDGYPLGPTDGFPVPSAPIAQAYYHPDVASISESTYMVTWHFFEYFSNDHGDVFARLVNATDGGLMSPVINIDLSPYLESDASVACDGMGTCLVAYEHNAIAFPSQDTDIRGRIYSLSKTFVPIVIK